MKKFLSMLLATVLILAAIPANAFAANVCKDISGSQKYSTTFKVSTKTRLFGLSDKLTLRGTKGKAVIEKMSGKEDTQKTYGYYHVYVTDTTTKKTQEYEWEDDRTLSIKLEKNSFYSVTVEPYTIGRMQSSWFFGATRDFVKWATYPKWEVVRTKGIEWCY